MTHAPFKTLILCTGNSARSIIGEYLLREKGRGRFAVVSAGAKPTGQVNPLALWVLKEHYAIDASDARSESWEEFREVNFDLVITVCDNAKEACPIFPGHPVTAHFGSPDPADAPGTDEQKKRVFLQVATQIARRIDLLCALPDAQLDPSGSERSGSSTRREPNRAHHERTAMRPGVVCRGIRRHFPPGLFRMRQCFGRRLGGGSGDALAVLDADESGARTRRGRRVPI